MPAVIIIPSTGQTLTTSERPKEQATPGCTEHTNTLNNAEWLGPSYVQDGIWIQSQSFLLENVYLVLGIAL